MKKIFVLCLFLAALVESAAQVSFGDPALFNEGWKFILADNPAMKNADYDDSRWRSLDLPHDWSIEGQLSPTLASCTGFLPGGIGWYRKTISCLNMSVNCIFHIQIGIPFSNVFRPVSDAPLGQMHFGRRNHPHISIDARTTVPS